jgi:hypothetical protein
MSAGNIIFEQIRSSGCLSYLLGCPEKKKCIVIDPELDKADEYIELAKFFSSELLYAIDTHTHADHNSACKVLREKHGIKAIMHEATDAPYIDMAVKDGDVISFGSQSIKVIYTPGHTQDAMCLLCHDRIFTVIRSLLAAAAEPTYPAAAPNNNMRACASCALLAMRFGFIPAMIIAKRFQLWAMKSKKTRVCCSPAKRSLCSS